MKGNTWIQRLSLAVLLMSSIAAPGLALASSDDGTLTVGGTSVPCTGGEQLLRGYSGSLPFGAYSPTGLTGGDTVSSVFDNTPFLCGPTYTAFSYLAISGFSSNPGSSWLSSITCNGVTNEQSHSSQYVYSSGTAEWYWYTQFGLASHNGSNVACTIVHS
jgi:hypothetical protein